MSFPVPRTRWRSAAMCCAAALVVAGCSSIPSDSAPQALRPYSPPTPSEQVITPVDGQEPDLLLRGFFSAAATPTQRHQGARAFMTAERASLWDDQSPVTILDRIDLNAISAASENSVSYVVRGDIVGTLGAGGVYTPSEGSYQSTIRLIKDNGQWRIAELPNGVVFERTELLNHFTPRDLFYFDPGERMLVRDRRWVYDGQNSVDTAMLSLLVEGPKGMLKPAVRTMVPPNAAFTGRTDNVYSFTGFSGLAAETRHKFAAQVVWTLARSGRPGPYRVQLDGAPIDPDHTELTVEDVAEFNPLATAGKVPTVYAIDSGSLDEVASNVATPVQGPLGSSGRILSAAVSGDTAAAVIGERPAAAPADGGQPSRAEASQTLVAGPLGGPNTTITQARSFTEPTFEYGASAVWTVADGNTIIRAARSTGTGEISQTEVDSTLLDSINPEGLPITAFKLSSAGVRAALIIGGKLYVAIIDRPVAGERKIVEVTEVARSLGDTSVTMDWQLDDSIVVGTSRTDAPMWRVEFDGSSIAHLPTGNITAPVRSVAATSTTLYVTDARAALQLPIASTGSTFWREVSGLQGTAATVVVSN